MEVVHRLLRVSFVAFWRLLYKTCHREELCLGPLCVRKLCYINSPLDSIKLPESKQVYTLCPVFFLFSKTWPSILEMRVCVMIDCLNVLIYPSVLRTVGSLLAYIICGQGRDIEQLHDDDRVNIRNSFKYTWFHLIEISISHDQSLALWQLWILYCNCAVKCSFLIIYVGVNHDWVYRWSLRFA